MSTARGTSCGPSTAGCAATRRPASTTGVSATACRPGRPQDKAPRLTESKDLFEEVGVHGGGVAFLGHTALGLVVLDQAQGQPADQGQVDPRGAVGHPVLVLPEGHVQAPMAGILDGPGTLPSKQ